MARGHGARDRSILALGSSFYLLAALAAPVAVETGWPLSWVVGGFSVGLLVVGLVSPRVGGAIGRHGGRPVLALHNVVLVGALWASMRRPEPMTG